MQVFPVHLSLLLILGSSIAAAMEAMRLRGAEIGFFAGPLSAKRSEAADLFVAIRGASFAFVEKTRFAMRFDDVCAACHLPFEACELCALHSAGAFFDDGNRRHVIHAFHLRCVRRLAADSQSSLIGRKACCSKPLPRSVACASFWEEDAAWEDAATLLRTLVGARDEAAIAKLLLCFFRRPVGNSAAAAGCDARFGAFVELLAEEAAFCAENAKFGVKIVQLVVDAVICANESAADRRNAQNFSVLFRTLHRIAPNAFADFFELLVERNAFEDVHTLKLLLVSAAFSPILAQKGALLTSIPNSYTLIAALESELLIEEGEVCHVIHTILSSSHVPLRIFRLRFWKRALDRYVSCSHFDEDEHLLIRTMKQRALHRDPNTLLLAFYCKIYLLKSFDGV